MKNPNDWTQQSPEDVTPGRRASTGDLSPRAAAAGKAPAATGSSRGRWLERLGLMLFGLSLAFLLLEGGLQIASLFFGSRPIEAIAAAQHTVLAVGDSHTYGVYLSQEEAYPRQLQAELERRKPGRYQVLNLGLPGTNSSQIRARLPAWLDRYQPRTVVFCAGINNTWNKSDTEALCQESALTRWIQGLRTYRLFKLLALRLQTAAPGRPDIERVVDGAVREHRDSQTGEVLIRHEGDPNERLAIPRVLELLHHDLEQIHALVQARGVRLILLNYAEPSRESLTRLSDAMTRFGQAHGIPVVDPRPRFQQLLAEGAARTVYFASERDSHPRARGYTEVATQVADVIEPADTITTP